MANDLVKLQRKYGHLKIAGDNLILGERGGLVLISTDDYFTGKAIVNLSTGERYPVKYDGWNIPYKRLFEVSKALSGDVRYSVRIPMYGRGYELRHGTYRVAELTDGKLEAMRFPTVEKAIKMALHLTKNNLKPELL